MLRREDTIVNCQSDDRTQLDANFLKAKKSEIETILKKIEEDNSIKNEHKEPLVILIADLIFHEQYLISIKKYDEADEVRQELFNIFKNSNITNKVGDSILQILTNNALNQLRNESNLPVTVSKDTLNQLNNKCYALLEDTSKKYGKNSDECIHANLDVIATTQLPKRYMKSFLSPNGNKERRSYHQFIDHMDRHDVQAYREISKNLLLITVGMSVAAMATIVALACLPVTPIALGVLIGVTAGIAIGGPSVLGLMGFFVDPIKKYEHLDTAEPMSHVVDSINKNKPITATR